MHRTIGILALLTAIFIIGAPPAPAKDRPSTHSRIAHATPAPSQLYSRRALRRAQLIVQLRLLALKKARLQAIEAAIRRRLEAAGVITPAPHEHY